MSLQDWQKEARAAFEEIENAHRAVGGTKPGRRFVTQQLNYAYVTLLAPAFKGSLARYTHRPQIRSPLEPTALPIA